MKVYILLMAIVSLISACGIQDESKQSSTAEEPFSYLSLDTSYLDEEEGETQEIESNAIVLHVQGKILRRRTPIVEVQVQGAMNDENRTFAKSASDSTKHEAKLFATFKEEDGKEMFRVDIKFGDLEDPVFLGNTVETDFNLVYIDFDKSVWSVASHESESDDAYILITKSE